MFGRLYPSISAPVLRSSWLPLIALGVFGARGAYGQENSAPVPNIFHSSLRGETPHSVIFNAINSFDADGDDIMVTWHWGDGTETERYPKEGPPGSNTGAVEHVFETVGAFPVTALLEDARGASAEWDGVIVVVEEHVDPPTQPRAIFTITPEQPGLGEWFTLDGRLSFDRPSMGSVSAYHWDLGDGSRAAGPTVEHRYTAPADYTITLTVEDDELPPNTDRTSRMVRIEFDDDEPDRDGDGVPDAFDFCPEDPDKTAPGACGCAVSESDRDSDGTPDCLDQCPDEPMKVNEGDCGCGAEDTDQDGDGVADCIDQCPDDPAKAVIGLCGCGVPETDSDGDAAPDCLDDCPLDPMKIAPQQCGCGESDVDQDDDGAADCIDKCPLDPTKTDEGACGCGAADVDSDRDGALDCQDQCPLNPLKTNPGICGCDSTDSDADVDGVVDCVDDCPGSTPGAEVDPRGCELEIPENLAASPSRSSGNACGAFGPLLICGPCGLLFCGSSFRKRKFAKRCTIALCPLLLIACVSDQAHRYYATERFPKRQPDEVELLFDTPARPHIVIADFQARGASPEYMQKMAAEIGADAVIVGMYGGFRAISDEWAGEDRHSKTYSRITGTAIRYRR